MRLEDERAILFSLLISILVLLGIHLRSERQQAGLGPLTPTQADGSVAPMKIPPKASVSD